MYTTIVEQDSPVNFLYRLHHSVEYALPETFDASCLNIFYGFNLLQKGLQLFNDQRLEGM